MGDEYNLLGGSANGKSAACLETHFSNINEESSSILSENGILLLSRYILQALPHEQGASAPSCFGGFNFTVKMPDHLPLSSSAQSNSMRGSRLKMIKIFADAI